MNIVLLVLNNFTNDARVTKEARTLASSGHKVTVVALWQPGLAEKESLDGFRVIRLHLRSRPLKNKLISPIIKYLEFGYRVWSLAGKETTQVYHANDANTLPAAWLASKRSHASLVYDAHELETGRNFSGFALSGIYRKIWPIPEKLFIHRAKKVITVSASIARKLSQQYKISTPQVILNCPEKSDGSKSNRLRDELHIPDDQYILLYQGRVAEGRGIEAFFNSIQMVENTVGVILGDGPALESLSRRTQSGEWKRVYMPGRVSLADLPSYTASADIGMVLIEDTCLSYHLSLPNKLFEYLHAGLPVICSDLPEIARIVQDYNVGQLTDPNNPQAIANSIQHLLNSPDYFASTKANTAKAAANFNWQNESLKLLDIYRSLAPDEEG